MTRLVGFSARQVITALQRLGFQVVSQKGSHIKLRKWITSQKLTVIVPNHKELKPGVMDSILEMAELSPEEFKKHL